MDLFVDLYQSRQISEARSEASKAQGIAERVDQRITELERRADRTALACQALWEILKLKTGVTEAEVFAEMEEIDLRDGKADGKISNEVLRCGRCNRAINTARPVCIYCGHKNSGGTIAR